MESDKAVTGPSFIDRVKAIILKPKEEWPRIAAEPDSESSILTRYVLPLAAIGPVAGFIGGQVFGHSFLFVSSKPSLVSGLVTAIVTYVISIIGIYVLALIANFLAPKFDGEENRLNAFKLVAYGATAAWVAGIFNLVPALSFFTILGLYSLYLFYTGAAPLMKVPEDKLLGFTAVTFLCAFVLNLLVGVIAGLVIGIIGLGGGSISSISEADNDVTVSIPGVGSVNTNDMERAAERMERVQSGEIKAVPADTLMALLPETIDDFTRTGTSSQALGNAGSGVEGTYTNGDQSFDLRVNDMLALSGIAGIGAAMGIETSEQNADGYEKIGTVDGQWREEKWNVKSKRGTYATMVSNRFRVEASGTVPDISVLKDAVNEIDADELKDLSGE